MTSLQAPELSTTPDIDLATRLKAGRDHIITELRTRIIGQEAVIEQVLTALFAVVQAVLLRPVATAVMDAGAVPAHNHMGVPWPPT